MSNVGEFQIIEGVLNDDDRGGADGVDILVASGLDGLGGAFDIRDDDAPSWWDGSEVPVFRDLRELREAGEILEEVQGVGFGEQ